MKHGPAKSIGDLLNDYEQLKRQYNVTKHELIQARQTIYRQSKQIDKLHDILRVIELQCEPTETIVKRSLSQVLYKLDFIQRTIASYYKRLREENED